MPKFLAFFILSLVFVSCVQEDPENGSSSGDNFELDNKIKQLELDNALKDSVINESLAFFNEIKANLESIGVRKDQIRTISDNPEISSDDKEWILEEIRHINFLREENARKVKQLQTELKINGLKIQELEIMLEQLMKDIQWKDEQISLLQSELDDLDEEYSKLFDAYQEQAIAIDQLTEEVNKVYYAYGTEKELKENHVIEKKNGFIGLGRKPSLKDDINDEYFTAMDITKKKTIMVDGNKPHIVTDHPSSSYELTPSGGRTKLTILDASEFWKISRYLVIVVD
jgi:vacuolar-type H+-ATPase subunit I/STV1